MAKKILLIDPPFQKFMNFSKAHIPLGLLYLVPALQKNEHVVQVYDADYNPNGKSSPFIEKIEHYHDYIDGLNNYEHPIWKEIEEKVNTFQPNVVGISVISTKLLSGFKVAERLKKMGVEKIVMGGPHATLDPEEVIENQYVDTVVVGEGEEVFEDAIENKGIIRAPIIKNLDRLAWPTRDTLINLEQYKLEDLGMIMSGRGCPYSCNFCCSEALWGRTVRNRSIDNVVAEIEDIHLNHNVNNFYIIDDTFTIKKSRVLDFSERMNGNSFAWSCLTRVDAMDDEIVRAMKESGCYMVKVGLESGSDRVLQLMNKKIDKDDVRYASKLFEKYDLSWLAYIIVGTPGETVEEVYETMNFIQEVKPTYVSFSNFTPYPGTEFYKRLGLGRIEYHRYNHHTAIRTGQIPVEKILEAARFADDYNVNAKLKLFSEK